MGESETPFVYDRVSYPTAIVPAMTPNRLHAAGILHGWLTPDPLSARLLEVGGNDGLNTIVMAANTPGSKFAAFDLSAPTAERGHALAAKAGLANIDLHHGDILTYPRDGAPFDYIVAHGVYAWIPDAVRASLLNLIAARPPGGVAYVSYDCLPGAAMKAQLGRFFRDQLAHLDDADAMADGMAQWTELLAENQAENSVLRPALAHLQKSLPRSEPHYLFHDILAEHYAPVSYGDFATAAWRHGLAVAGDAELRDFAENGVSDGARRLLGSAGDDVLARGKLLDMLRGNTTFRATMLCRRDAPPPAGDGLAKLRFAAAVRREPANPSEGHARYSFGIDGMLSLGPGVERAILDALIDASPGEITFTELADLSGLADIAQLLSILRVLCAMKLVVPHATPQPFVTRAGPRPRIGAFNSMLVAEQGFIVTPRHARITISNDAARVLLAHCDGMSDLPALAAIVSRHEGAPVPVDDMAAALDRLAEHGVFIA